MSGAFWMLKATRKFWFAQAGAALARSFERDLSDLSTR
jgi:hypothetical protein